MEFKIYIDPQFIYNRVDIHAVVFRKDGKEVLSYKDGSIISTIVEESVMTAPMLSLPTELFKAIEERILLDLEQRGGAPSQQYLRGRVEELEKFNEWLKSQVENIPYIPKAKND